MRNTTPQIEVTSHIELSKSAAVEQETSWTYSKGVLKSWHDLKTARNCTILIYIFLVLLGSAILYYEITEYYSSANSITRSEITKITQIDFPYFFVYGLGYLYNMSLAEVELGNKSFTNIAIYNYTDFSYTEDITTWSIVTLKDEDGQSTHEWQFLIVPPYNQKIHVSDKIMFNIKSMSYPSIHGIEFTDDSHSKSQAISYHHANSPDFALLWRAGPVDKLNSVQFNGSYETEFDTFKQFELYEYTLVGTYNFIQIEPFKEVNKITGIHEKTFEMTSKATILDADLTRSYHNEIESILEYQTIYYFFLRPVGDVNDNGKPMTVQTVLTTDRLYSFVGIFSKSGGIFSPFKDGALLLLSWMLFGIPVCACCAGIASKKGLDNEEKERIKIYLEEIGVLDTKGIEKIKRHETEYKMKRKCCC